MASYQYSYVMKNLKKSFPGGRDILKGVTLSFLPDVKIGVLGVNGAGKTTVFNLLTGVYPIDDGTVVLDGMDISHVPSQDRVIHGMSRSFQNIRLMPHLSTIENVMLGQHARARSFGNLLFPLGLLPNNIWRKEAEAALQNAGIGSYPGEVVANLPYGVQKRIEVVRAMVSQPKLLLLDEPAAGLNEIETRQLQELLEKVSTSGVTILLVEHDMHFVRNLCDHVVVLNFGQKIFEGTPDEVHQNPAVLEAYLGRDNSQPAKETSNAS